MADYRKRIHDLLALAERETTNEYEARDALLRARKLMAEHKITELELENTEKQAVVRELTGVTYSMRRDPWILELSAVIGEHHCCRPFYTREKRKQVAEIGFVGLSGDTPLCRKIFVYAVDCIRMKTNKLRKEPYKGVSIADGYGYGFTMGLKDAYYKQQSEEGWGLVLTVPKEVNDFTDKMSRGKANTSSKKKQASARSFIDGMNDGRKFHEQKRIKEASERKN